jgi:hypothetical protein
VADDPTPTPNSDPTDPPATPPSDPPAGDPPVPPADDGLGTTALGNDPADPPADDPDAGKKAEVPEAYELATPEGFEKLDETAVAEATPVFKELGLSNEQANKLVPVAASFAKRIVEDRDQQLMGTILEQRKDWLETAKKDPEIGGTHWDGTISSAAKALDQLGFPKGSPLRVALDDSGFGNHPEMIRLMSKVGKAIGEDADFARATTGKDKKTDAEIFYGPQK